MSPRIKEFLASNVKSIALSKIYTYLIPSEVCDDEEIVGFTRHGKDPKSKKYRIFRLMIDKKFQGKALEKKATLKLIEKTQENEDCNEAVPCYREYKCRKVV